MSLICCPNKRPRTTSAAQRHSNSATAHLNLYNSHNSLAQDYSNQYEEQYDLYEAKGGVWKKRTEEDVTCLVRENEDPESEFCITQLGEAQIAEDAYLATALYQSLTDHREAYDSIVALINEKIEEAQEQQTTATDLETEVRDSGTIYWQTLDIAADGQIKQARFGNGVETSWNYDNLGRTAQVNAQQDDHTDLQNMFFQYDAIGNLTAREDYVNDLHENFTYDTINRLTQAELSGAGAAMYELTGQQSQSFQYDALGNITYKSDVGHYTYGHGMSISAAGPHAVISTDGIINTNFSYDANGNQIAGHGRSVDFSSFNKPVEINKGGNLNHFNYGPERQLIYQFDQTGESNKETRYIGGLFEEAVKDGVTESVHHLKISKFTVAVLKTAPDLSAVNSTHYLHQDHLDSVVMITDADGDVVEKRHYDAFGKQRNAVLDNEQQVLAAGFLPITDFSFTGHRYLKGQELIHMKGRVYDPTFGRFISADPHIQSPLMSQSLNRYSYVLNNPLSMTDPSGYFFSFFKKLFKKILNLVKNIVKKVVAIIKKVIKAVEKVIQKIVMSLPVAVRIVIVVVIAVYAPQIAAQIATWVTGTTVAVGSLSLATVGAITGGLSGLVMTGSLKGMVIGAVTGAAFGYLGAKFGTFAKPGAWGSAIKNAFGAGARFVFRGAQILAHGVTGGILSRLQGGSFSAGFKAAGLAKAITLGTNTLGGIFKNAEAGKFHGGQFLLVTGSGYLVNGKLGAINAAAGYFFNQMGGVGARNAAGQMDTQAFENDANYGDSSGYSPYVSGGGKVAGHFLIFGGSYSVNGYITTDGLCVATTTCIRVGPGLMGSAGGNANVGVVRGGRGNIQGGSIGIGGDIGIPGAFSGASLTVSQTGGEVNVRGTPTGAGISGGLDFCYTSRCVP